MRPERTPVKMLATLFVALAVAWALAAETAHAAESDPVAALLAKVTSADIDVRYASRTEAPAVGAAAVPELVKLIDETVAPPSSGAEADRLRREIALTARFALESIVHHAGRPGAVEERKAVAAGLARELSADRTPKTKREVLWLLAFVASDAEVPAVAALIDDPDRNVHETARIALERIPAPAATQALLAAEARVSPERRPDLLIAVGRKGDPTTVSALARTARGGEGKLRFAALKGLAHTGSADAIPVFVEILKKEDLPERAEIYGEFLRLADNLADARQKADAQSIHAAALKWAPLEHQRERALFRLTQDGGNMDALLVGVADPSDRVRRLAVAGLAALGGADVAARLRAAYDTAGEAARPALLRVLAERDRAIAKPLLEEAAKSQDPELKLVALDIEERLDTPEMELLYLELAESGSPQARPIALEGCLALARRAVDAGDAAKALSLYGRALELAASSEQKVAAIRGLGALGDPKAIDRVAALLADPALANEAARGVISLGGRLAASGDADGAEERLMRVVTGELPKEIRAEAAEALTKMGRDPRRAVRQQGFVVDWYLLTPIQDPDGTGLEKEHFPEKTIDLQEQTTYEGRKYRWQKLTEISLDGRINLLTSFRRSDKVLTYAYTEIESPGEADVLFKMGSDDGIACWLDGQRIHLMNAARGLTVDQDVVKARLKAGKNRILLKVSNGGGDWEFAFRITDPEGKPLEFETVR